MVLLAAETRARGAVGELAAPHSRPHGHADAGHPRRLGVPGTHRQSLRLWSALTAAEHGTGRHRFLFYPDEKQWVLKPQNSAGRYETELAFLDEHMHGGGVKAAGPPWQIPCFDRRCSVRSQTATCVESLCSARNSVSSSRRTRTASSDSSTCTSSQETV